MRPCRGRGPVRPAGRSRATGPPSGPRSPRRRPRSTPSGTRGATFRVPWASPSSNGGCCRPRGRPARAIPSPVHEEAGRELQAPHLAVQPVVRFRCATGDPDPVLEDVGGMLVPPRPGDVRLQLGPSPAVLRETDVAEVALLLRPPSEDPEPVAIDERREPEPGLPGGGRGHPRPPDAVLGAPDVVGRDRLRGPGAAPHHPETR